MNRLKEEFLKLLEVDVEFRYAVAGYLGLLEVLKRLDSISQEQVKLREEQVRLREDFKELREEQIKLREDFNSLREEQIRLREDFNSLREEQIRLREAFNELREEQIKLREDFNSLREEQVRLREDFNKLREDFNEMLGEIKLINMRLSRVERTLEKLTVDVEDEARSIVKHRLKTELGLDVELTSLSLPDLEVNIYGTAGDLCVVGEATVRAGPSLVDELKRKVEVLKSTYPDKLRPKLIQVIYTSLPLPELIEEAKKKGIWLLKATQEYHKPTLT
mgnify:CR=1 FL=1